MKIGMNEVIGGIEKVAMDRIKEGLEKEGFNVTTNKNFDIYAEKETDRRIYELKLGKNKIQKKQYVKLQKKAEELGAKLYIVYLEIPYSKSIEFDGLNELLYENIINNFPNELDILSTHTYIEEISDIDISSIEITDNGLKANGSGSMYLRLQYGSDSDIKSDIGAEDYMTVDFFFKVTVNVSLDSITKAYYKFDTQG